jgi:peptidoglycan/xylan/chitin deacetylase (PgdA/CDA1 family)
MKSNNLSAFVLSLDFELFWGVYESRGSEYYPAIQKVFTVVPRLLELFEKYEIACTWATVGALFLEDVEGFEAYKPKNLPQYVNRSLSPYDSVNNIASLDKKLLFAPELIKKIIKTPRQEIGAHTFAHYYTLEPGASTQDFRSDLEANLAVAEIYGLDLKSFVFPRNQFNREYLEVCSSANFLAYRGSPDHWAYKVVKGSRFNIFKRAFRLFDAYLPVSGHLTHSMKLKRQGSIYNVPATLFFRAYSAKFKLIEHLKIKRMKFSMTIAARKGKLCHFWWHPHNFASNIDKNLAQIEELLRHFKFLEKKYNMVSMSMQDVAALQGKTNE